MSSPRGRIVRPGGMAVDPQGATARTEPGPGNAPITRPAYRVSQGVMQPAGVAGGVGGPHPFLDFSGLPFWRTAITLAALGWLGFVWISLRGGLSGGVRL